MQRSGTQDALASWVATQNTHTHTCAHTHSFKKKIKQCGPVPIAGDGESKYSGRKHHILQVLFPTRKSQVGDELLP